MYDDDSSDDILTLLVTERYAEAAERLEALLEEMPEDAPTFALYALCLSADQRWERAEAAAREAVRLDGELAYCHWVLGHVLADRRRYPEALLSARQALRLAPEEADHHALHARCLIGRMQWDAGRAAAERALAIDPDHAPAQRLRAVSLQQKGFTSDAEQAFVDLSALDPEDSFSRAGRGWTALRGDPGSAAALQHFYHALQLDPTSEWARTGLLAALKARNPIYRIFLRYFLWMESLPSRTRAMTIIGGIIGFNLLRRLAEAAPTLTPLLYPLMGAYLLFILLTWTADPLFDFLLRLDPEARSVVPAERRLAAAWVAGVLGIGVAAFLLGLGTGLREAYLVALLAGFLIIPLSGSFQCAEGWPRRTMAIYTGGLGVAGVAALVTPPAVGGILLVIALLGAVVGSWLAQGLSRVVPTR